MVVDNKKGKRAKKNCKPTPQEEKEEADRVLLEREPKSEAPGEWWKVTKVPYGDYHPYLFDTSTFTDTRLCQKEGQWGCRKRGPGVGGTFVVSSPLQRSHHRCREGHHAP